jgi:hypothetical protein
MSPWMRGFAYLWASPATLLGLLLAACAYSGSTRYRRHDGVLEVCGPRCARWLALPWYGSGQFAAITLGHVVLARDDIALGRCRAHERVHVAQYERWGVLLLPAYLIASAIAKLRGGDVYYDNYFEVQARATEGSPRSSASSPPYVPVG